MKLQYLIVGLLLSVRVFGQTDYDEQLPIPVALLGGSFSDFERTPMSSWRGLTGDKTNINFIADYPKACSPEYTNVFSNTNLFTPDDQKLLMDIPLEYKSVATNSAPPGSIFLGFGKDSFAFAGDYVYLLFCYTNSEAQVKVFIDKHSDGKTSWIRFRTKSGDGYDACFYNNGIATFRQFKHSQLNGLWADFEGDHCAGWMRFVNGKAVGKWLVWNRTGSLYMEAEFKAPYDFIGHINFAP
jgi:hypothetical protein